MEATTFSIFLLHHLVATRILDCGVKEVELERNLTRFEPWIDGDIGQSWATMFSCENREKPGASTLMVYEPGPTKSKR